jgi:UDP-2-acetamido-3-amino-2,3-dideoxy-glucuronate N-acetyltransferase
VAYNRHPTADVEPGAQIGDGTSIWQLAHIREHASVGRHCVVGRGAYIGAGVLVGDNVKIQNYALLYEPAQIGDGAFIGPAAVLTNDTFPRAVNPDGTPKGAADWRSVGVTVLEGASVGARAVCVAPVTIGRWACVGAGAVVVHDVPDFALVVGVPARQLKWVGRAGVPLIDTGGGTWRCPRTGAMHLERDGGLREMEDATR